MRSEHGRGRAQDRPRIGWERAVTTCSGTDRTPVQGVGTAAVHPCLPACTRVARWRTTRNLALGAIMALALVLRVSRPDIAEFKLDEVQPLELAAQIWCDHRLPVTRGLTSFGLPGTPGVGYLLVLPRALSADPQVSVAFMGLLGTLAVFVTYLAARRLGGERLGLVSAATMAANPWAAILSRKTWSEVQPLFTALFLWAGYEVVARRRPRWALAFFPLLALQFQTHPLAVLYLPALVATLAVFWPRWRSRYTLWGALVAGVIAAPYLALLARQWEATRVTLSSQAAKGFTVDGRALTYALWHASGKTFTALLGQSTALLRSWEQALGAVNVITAVALAGGLAACLWAVAQGRQREEAALLLIWVVAPVLPLVIRPGDMGVHYLLLVSPALYVLAAVGWTVALAASRRAVVAAATVLLTVMLLVQAGAVLAVFDGVVQYPVEGGFGRPLRHWREVQRGVLAEMAAGEWHELQVLGTNDATWASERNALDYLLGRSISLRYVGQGGRPGLLVPERGDALALVMSAGEELKNALATYGRELARWELPGSDWGVRLYVVRGHKAEELATGVMPAQPGHFENGMRLLGARLPQDARPGDLVAIEMAWAYSGAGTHLAAMGFNHLIDAEGKRWAQDDGFALARQEWRPGETLLQWCYLALPSDLPPGDYWLFSGMYSLQDMSRANLLDDQGRWLGDGVRLGPIRVVSR